MMIKISKAHQRFADYLNNQRALDYPEEFLGPNWKDVLNFWLFLDTLSPEQLKTVSDSFKELDYSARIVAMDTAWVAGNSGDVAYYSASAAAQYAAQDAARHTRFAADYATWELIRSHKILSQNKPLTFLPLFLNL